MIDAWSFSRWSTYDGCPQQAKFKFIDKLREKEGPALARGRDVHGEAERFVCDGGALPRSLDRFATEFAELRAARAACPEDVLVEAQWAFYRDAESRYQPCEWYGRRTWLRIKVDLCQLFDDASLLIVDYKTGKIRDGYEKQLELYALGGFNWFEGVDRIRTELWYLDQGEIRDATYEAEQREELEATWDSRVRPMLQDRTFRPQPGGACRFCSFSRGNGGPCEF